MKNNQINDENNHEKSLRACLIMPKLKNLIVKMKLVLNFILAVWIAIGNRRYRNAFIMNL